MSPNKAMIIKRLAATKKAKINEAKGRAASLTHLAIVHAERMGTPTPNAPKNGLTAHYLNAALAAAREAA